MRVIFYISMLLIAAYFGSEFLKLDQYRTDLREILVIDYICFGEGGYIISGNVVCSTIKNL